MQVKHREAETLVVHLSEVFWTFCHKHDLTPFSVAAEKHGSVVWEVGTRDTLKRFLMLGLTPTGPEGAASQVEIWISADDGTHYVTKQFTRLTVPCAGDAISALNESMDQRLNDAWKAAVGLGELDLIEAYSVPRR